MVVLTFDVDKRDGETSTRPYLNCNVQLNVRYVALIHGSRACKPENSAPCYLRDKLGDVYSIIQCIASVRHPLPTMTLTRTRVQICACSPYNAILLVSNKLSPQNYAVKHSAVITHIRP